jgi:anthranilate phosphoribosyltransferase
VPRPELCEPLAQVLKALGLRRGMVVCGEVPSENGPGTSVDGAVRYLDELSTLGSNHLAEFYQERGLATSTLEPAHFPIQRASLADLAGSDRLTNAGIVRRIVDGSDRGPKRDAVLFNAAAALFLGGRARSLSEGWVQAAGLIDEGETKRKLAELSS